MVKSLADAEIEGATAIHRQLVVLGPVDAVSRVRAMLAQRGAVVVPSASSGLSLAKTYSRLQSVAGRFSGFMRRGSLLDKFFAIGEEFRVESLRRPRAAVTASYKMGTSDWVPHLSRECGVKRSVVRRAVRNGSTAKPIELLDSVVALSRAEQHFESIVVNSSKLPRRAKAAIRRRASRAHEIVVCASYLQSVADYSPVEIVKSMSAETMVLTRLDSQTCLLG